MLERSKCVLRRLTTDDGALVLRWRNSDRVRANMYVDRPIAQDEHLAWLRRAVAAADYDARIFEYGGRPIGLVTAADLQREDGRCTIGYYLGEPDAPKGSGSCMTWFMLRALFEDAGLRKVSAEAFSFNVASLRMLRRLGFVQEGRLTAHREKRGKPEDVIVMALFADVWRSRSAVLARELFASEPEAAAR